MSFRFFLETKPLASACCAQRTPHPKWDQTVSIKQIVNDDFVHYVSNEAVELEIWGAPETNLEAPEGYVGMHGVGHGGSGPVGEHIEVEMDEEDQDRANRSGDGGEDSEGADVNDIDYWKRKVDHLEETLEELQRESKTASELAVGLAKHLDPDKAHKLIDAQRKQLHPSHSDDGAASAPSSPPVNVAMEAIKLAKKRVHELEDRIKDLEDDQVGGRRRGGGSAGGFHGGDGDGQGSDRGGGASSWRGGHRGGALGIFSCLAFLVPGAGAGRGGPKDSSEEEGGGGGGDGGGGAGMRRSKPKPRNSATASRRRNGGGKVHDFSFENANGKGSDDDG